jgi:Xaa-Pro aminopeptidase
MGDAILIVPASPVQYRNADTEYPFRQDSSFHYLTGFDEPDAVAVLSQKGKRRRFYLFVNPKDAHAELWTGRRLGPKEARRRLEATRAYPVDEFGERIADLLPGHQKVYMPLGTGWEHERSLLERLSRLRTLGHRQGEPRTLEDYRGLLGELRTVKSPEEIDRIRDAVGVTAQGIAEVMATLVPGQGEEQVRAVCEYAYHVHGGGWAFETIAAGGANACILHYSRGRDELRDGDLMVLDTGAEVDGYGADVTRTLPVNGRYSRSQERLYRVVLDGLTAAIEVVRPGATIHDVHQRAMEVVAEGLVRLGLLRGRATTLVKNGKIRRYFPHGTSHWLGRDAHDLGSYHPQGHDVVLEPGSVITVEPGVYIPPDDRSAPPRFRGVGIRLEEDVLVTDGDPEVLSAAIPIEPRDVERAMSARPRLVRRLPARREVAEG